MWMCCVCVVHLCDCTVLTPVLWPEQHVGCFPVLLSTLLPWDRVSHWSQTCHWLPGKLESARLNNTGLTGTGSHAHFLIWGLGIWAQLLMVAKYSDSPSHLPSSVLLKKNSIECICVSCWNPYWCLDEKQNPVKILCTKVSGYVLNAGSPLSLSSFSGPFKKFSKGGKERVASDIQSCAASDRGRWV